MLTARIQACLILEPLCQVELNLILSRDKSFHRETVQSVISIVDNTGRPCNLEFRLVCRSILGPTGTLALVSKSSLLMSPERDETGLAYKGFM